MDDFVNITPMMDLIQKLNNATEAYDRGEPYMSDREWDDLYFQLEKMEDEAGFTLPNSPTQKVVFEKVSELKKEISKMKFNSLNFNKNKVSTVDEFQGKEEDIIIVNFVRNNPKFEAGEFVKKFERINVALSRARKMLVIVGAREFFESLQVELENLDDSTIKKVRRLYKEIYNRVKGHIDNPYSYF